MKKIIVPYFLITILFCCSPELYSQNNKADSLKQLIHSSSKENELKVDRLNELASAIKKTNTEEMKPLLDEARFLAQKLNYSKGIADYYITKSLYYFNTKEFEKGIVLTDSAITLCTKKTLNQTLTSAYFYKGYLYNFQDKRNEAIKCFNLALKNDSLHPGDNSFLVKIYQAKGYALFFIGKTEEAKLTFKKLIKTASLIHDYKKMANAYYMLAKSYGRHRMWDEYNSYLDTAIFYSEKVDYPHITVTLLNEKARQFAEKQEYTEALDLFLRALDESKRIEGYHTWESILHGAIGQIHMIFENFDEAKLNFEIGLEAAINQKSKQQIVYHSRSLGHVLEKKGDYEEALIQCDYAIKIAKESKLFLELPYTYQRIAIIKTKMGLHKEAVYNCDSALLYAPENKVPIIYNRLLITVAQAKFNVNDIETAVYYLDKFYEFCKNNIGSWNRRDAHELYSKIYDKKKNYRKAYKHYVRYKELSDSIVNDKKVWQLANLESQYKFDKEKEAIQLEQEKKDALQKAELSRQKLIRNTMLGGLLLVIILALVILRSFIQKRKANKILAKQKEKIQSQNEKLLELDNFKQDMTGMIVHDLKNPLNVIINAPQTEPQLALKLAQQSGKQMLNMVLNILDVYKAEAAKISLDLANYTISTLLNNAIASVDYLIKQKNISLKVDTNTAYNIRVDGQLIERVLINLLTNAIKYTPLNGTITIGIIEANSLLKVSISDSGEGISEDKKHLVFDKFAQAQAKRSGSVRSTGLGLTFCKMAIETHRGEIGFESEHGKGATFWFTLQLAEQSEKISEDANKYNSSNDVKELSIEDITYLKPFVEQLKEVLVYESSEVEAVLSGIESGDNIALIDWKKSILDCVYTMNQERYTELLRL
ncbi:MAG: ATP-binding protein [Bacteroidales bacterium]|nr:ATP-binding protein [Bacteroidales bacterium]